MKDSDNDSTIYVTWQPDVAEAGQYFLTKINAGPLDITHNQIMEIAIGIEELDENTVYELCSILKVKDDSQTEVLY